MEAAQCTQRHRQSEVHPGVETGMADARDARAVRATLDPDLVSGGASLGRAIEADFFTPELWKPEYPNAAFENMRPDDAFWAARIVAQFDAEIVRALVEGLVAIQTRRPI